jgi:hypothetical protein
MSNVGTPPEENSNNLQSSDTCTSSLHVEQQLIYYPQVKDGYHWFWHPIAAPKSQDFEVTLPHLSPGKRSQGRLKLSLYGNAESEQNPDHHFQALINGQLVVDERWNGQGWQTLDAVIPADALENSLGASLAKRPALTLGEAFLSAQQLIPVDSADGRDVLQTFLLFGDPALHIARPTQCDIMSKAHCCPLPL